MIFVHETLLGKNKHETKRVVFFKFKLSDEGSIPSVSTIDNCYGKHYYETWVIVKKVPLQF